MFHAVRRILIGILFGGLTGALVGLMTGIIAGLVMGERTIFIMGPLEVGSGFVAGFLGVSMLLFGALAGGMAGMISAVVNKPGTGWVIGMLTGSMAGSILVRDILFAAGGALIGLIAGLVAERRVQKEPPPSPAGQSLRQMLQASADSQSRGRLGLWVGICLLAVGLGVYLLAALGPLPGIITIAVFGLGAIYFVCMLALKKS